MPSAEDKARELAALMGCVECEALLRDALTRRDAQWQARRGDAKAAGKTEGRAEMKSEAVTACNKEHDECATLAKRWQKRGAYQTAMRHEEGALVAARLADAIEALEVE